MKTVWCKMGGLMEMPWWEWNELGSASGETLKEVCDNLALTNTSFKEYYDPERLTYWGWKLALYPKD